MCQIIRYKIDKSNYPRRFQIQEQRPRNASMGGAIAETFCHSDQKQVKPWGNARTALATWCMFNLRQAWPSKQSGESGLPATSTALYIATFNLIPIVAIPLSFRSTMARLLNQLRPPLEMFSQSPLLKPAVSVILSCCKAKIPNIAAKPNDLLLTQRWGWGVIYKEMHLSQPGELGKLRQSNSDTLIGPLGNFPFQLNPSTVQYATQPCKLCRAERNVTLHGLTTPSIFLCSRTFTHLQYPQRTRHDNPNLLPHG